MIAGDAELVARLESRLTRPILMVTLAPEMAGAVEAVSILAKAGRVVAIGHSAADFGVVQQAADAGATLSTHLGNGLPQQMHKLANPLFAQLGEDRLMAGFIADGIHIDPRALKSLIRAKGLDRSILVTDAVVAAGAKPGRYDFAGMPVDLAEDGSVRQPGGLSLAGSALKLDDAVRNLVAWGIAPFEQAVAMASSHALAALAPALAAAGITLPQSELTWSSGLRIEHVRAGDVARSYPAEQAA
jgi:N-acetylglucosamine-6-phosphate deacetylase